MFTSTLVNVTLPVTSKFIPIGILDRIQYTTKLSIFLEIYILVDVTGSIGEMELRNRENI